MILPVALVGGRQSSDRSLLVDSALLVRARLALGRVAFEVSVVAATSRVSIHALENATDAVKCLVVLVGARGLQLRCSRQQGSRTILLLRCKVGFSGTSRRRLSRQNWTRHLLVSRRPLTLFMPYAIHIHLLFPLHHVHDLEVFAFFAGVRPSEMGLRELTVQSFEVLEDFEAPSLVVATKERLVAIPRAKIVVRHVGVHLDRLV